MPLSIPSIIDAVAEYFAGSPHRCVFDPALQAEQERLGWSYCPRCGMDIEPRRKRASAAARIAAKQRR